MSAQIPAIKKRPKGSKKILIVTLIIVGILFAVGVEKSTNSAQVLNYNSNLVCDNAWQNEKDYDYSKFTGDYFDITLHEGCWSGRVRTPQKWRTWEKQMVGNKSSWTSFWYEGWKPLGPYIGQTIPSFQYPPKVVRLQGSGIIRFYRTDQSDSQGKKP